MSFVPNPDFDTEMQLDPATRATLVAAAEDAAQVARSAAPTWTGNYARSISVGEDDGFVIVKTDDPSGHLIEWGSINNPPFAPLRKGAERVSGHFVEADEG